MLRVSLQRFEQHDSDIFESATAARQQFKKNFVTRVYQSPPVRAPFIASESGNVSAPCNSR
jgi:hypothetical protein